MHLPARTTVTAAVLLLLAALASATPASATTAALTPTADAYVDSSAPTVNNGVLTKLRTDGSPIVRSYLRFDVQGWVPGTSTATLRLTPTSSLNTGLLVSRVADTTWGERTITAANAPPLGSALGTTAPPKTSVPVALDVTSAISASGLVSFGVSSSDPTAEALASREAGAATSPQLVVDTVDTTPPAPTLTSPADGGSVASTTPTLSGVAGTQPGDDGSVTVMLWSGTDTSVAPAQTLPAAALAGGGFSIAPTTALAPGRYTWLAEQHDSSGNVGRSAARTFTVDTQAPAPTLTAPAAGSTTTDSTPTFAGGGGTSPGDAGSVTVQVWQGSDTSGTPLLALDAPRDATTGAFSVDAPNPLADGLYTARVRQLDAAGNAGTSATRSFTVATPTSPPPATTLVPVADAYVDSSASGTNYGALTKLRTDGSPIVRSYLRFDVQGWVPGTSRATLRLTPTSNLNTGLLVSRVADTTWGERTVTAANAPPLGSSLGTTAAPKTGVPLSIDVTAAISGNGPVTLALSSSDPTADALASREAGSATSPQLVVDNADSTPPAPTLTAPPDGAFVDTTSPLLTGVAGTAPGDASTVTVTVWRDTDTDEAPLMSMPAMVLPDGSFSVQPSSPLPDDVFTWLVEQRDAAGNFGRSASREFTVDTQAPNPILQTPADGSATNDRTPTFAGTAGFAPGDASSVSVLVWPTVDTSGTPLMTLPASRDGTGAFSVDSPTSLDEGAYTARVRQTDAAGHTGVGPVHAFTVDATTPAPTLTSPTGGSTTSDATPTFAGVGGTAPGDSATVAVDLWDGTDTSGAPLVRLTASADPATGAYSVDPGAALDGGSYTARAEQLDAAGNRGRSATTTFTVSAPDVTAPKPTLTAPAAGSSTNDSTPTLAGNAGTRPGDLPSVRVRVWTGTDTTAAPAVDVTTSAAAGGSFSVDAPSALGDGRYTARVDQDDATGNHGSSAEVAFTIDTAAPQPTLTTPTNGSTTTDPKPVFSGVAGTAAGDGGTVSVPIWSGNSATGTPLRTLTATPAAGGNYSVAPGSALPAGVYTARSEQADAAGNQGHSTAVTFTVNANDPTIAAAGDIACSSATAPTPTSCKQTATSDLLLQLNPDAVLALGDTQYEAGEYPNYLSQFDPSWGRVKAKLYPTVGNHEYGTSTNSGCDVNIPGDPRSYACGYFDYFDGKGNLDGRAGQRGQGYYAFDVGQWRIYAVNSNCGRTGAPGCSATSSQVQWLRADLAAHPRACQIMFMHHPSFTSDARNFDDQAFRDTLRPLWDAFNDYGGDLVLTGHSHFYERFAPMTPAGVPDPNGIQEIISGTGGRNLQPISASTREPNSVVQSSTSFGVLQLTLHPTSYDWRFVPIPGNTLNDSGTRTCH